MTQGMQSIPLSKLVLSPVNVRRTGRKDGVKQLAASIKAHGLLQNLTVRAAQGESGKPGTFEVVAGGRRLAALQTLVTQQAIKPNAAIPCRVIGDDLPTEISLAENALQCPMHPVDQYEAFAKLHEADGLGAEDIAARFGITAAVVKQRLKLGAVSPKLRAAYRRGDMSLDQLSAFTLTDDHARQEQVWRELPPFGKSRQAILRALGAGHVLMTDRRARFVCMKAYVEAGGAVVRDLFEQDNGFFADAALVERLAQEKLETHAKKIEAEGWKWVSVTPDFDFEEAAAMRRVFAKPVPLTKAERLRQRKLQARHDRFCETHGDEELPAKAAPELARIETALAALDREQFRPQDIAKAGAFVTVGENGAVWIARGYVRREDEPETKKAKAAQPKGKDGAAPLSAALVRELSACRTAALRNELAQNPALALIATVHAFAAETFYVGANASCLAIRATSASLVSAAPGIDESLGLTQIDARHAAWAKRMPDDPAALWTFVHGLGPEERLDLLAHCVAQTATALHEPKAAAPKAAAHADTLTRELAFGMGVYWQPRAANYLGRVGKERIVAAVREGVSDAAARKIAGFKKGAMAEAAERELAEKGWLPEALGGPAASRPVQPEAAE